MIPPPTSVPSPLLNASQLATAILSLAASDNESGFCRYEGEHKMYKALSEVGKSYGNAHGYVGLSVAVIGVAANAANIGVLTRPHMKSCTNLLLTALAIADLLTVASFLPIYPHFYIWRQSDAEPFGTPYPIAAYYLLFQVRYFVHREFLLL